MGGGEGGMAWCVCVFGVLRGGNRSTMRNVSGVCHKEVMCYYSMHRHICLGEVEWADCVCGRLQILGVLSKDPKFRKGSGVAGGPPKANAPNVSSSSPPVRLAR